MPREKPIVSIIVPVYNVEKYLPACIDSILAQTFRDFDLILVDDGSPDSSQAILEQYAQKDSRVRAFRKENGGVSSARNFGLERAEGEYIGFVDADDSVAPVYLEWLYEALDACSAPIAMCAYRYVQEGRKPETRPQPERPAPELVTAESYSWMCPSSGGHCWRMLTRKEILQEIRFDPELWYGEDALFFMQEFLKAGKLAFLPCALYDYTVREGSAVKQPSNARIYTAYLAWTKVWRLVQEYPDPMRATTEERYLMSCAEVYYRMTNHHNIEPEQEKLLQTAKKHRRAAWKIPPDQMSQKLQALMVGYCPRFGSNVWRLVQRIKNRKQKND